MERIARYRQLDRNSRLQPPLFLFLACSLSLTHFCSASVLFGQDKVPEKPQKNAVPQMRIQRLGIANRALVPQPMVVVQQNDFQVYISLRSGSSGRSRISLSIRGGAARQIPNSLEKLKAEVNAEIEKAVKNAERNLKHLTSKQVESLRVAANCEARYFLREIKTTMESDMFVKPHKQHELGQVIMKANQKVSALDRKYKSLLTGNTGLFQKVLTKLWRQPRPQLEAKPNSSGVVDLFLLDLEQYAGLQAETTKKVRKWLELKARHETYDSYRQVANLVLTTFDDPSATPISASQDQRLRDFCKHTLPKLPAVKQSK